VKKDMEMSPEKASVKTKFRLATLE
jgi:hypothetical protein